MNAMQDLINEEIASGTNTPASYLPVPWLNLKSGASGGSDGCRWDSRHVMAGKVHVSVELRCREGDVERLHGVAKETTRRLVACLHACEGISTEQLEAGGLKSLSSLVDSAASVVACWETGSLADAVNMMEADLDKLGVDVSKYQEIDLLAEDHAA